jgi:hypothetical protein
MKKLVVVVAVLLLAAGCGSDDGGDEASQDEAVTAATAASTATATPTPIPQEVAEAAVVVVVSALDAKNSLDLDEWLAAFKGGRRTGTPLHAEEILMNANQHWEVVEPCQVTGEDAFGDTVVECVISNTDDFWGAGGIFDTRAFEFSVDADGLITRQVGLTAGTSGFSSDRRNAFNHAFSQWLTDTYPDVVAETGFVRSSNGPGFDARNSAHMLIAVEYVDEFVAQSDLYPLEQVSE